MCFPGGTVVTNLPANAGDVRDVGLIPRSGRFPGGGHGNPLLQSQEEKQNKVTKEMSSFWRRKWQPSPVFLPGKSHGQKSLVSCSLGNSYPPLLLSLSSLCLEFLVLLCLELDSVELIKYLQGCFSNIYCFVILCSF